MKKSIKRIISLAIALIMTASTFATLTFTTNAATTIDPIKALTNNLDLILSMDDLKGTNLEEIGGDRISTDDNGVPNTVWYRDANKGIAVGEGGAIIGNKATNMYVSYAVSTKIPLGTDKKYTVQFTYQRPDTETANSITEFVLTGTDTATLNKGDTIFTSADYKTAQGVWLRYGDRMYAGWGNCYDNSSLATPNTVDNETKHRVGNVYSLDTEEFVFTEENTYTIVIDGTVIWVYINGIYSGEFDFAEDRYGGWAGQYLSLGVHGVYSVGNNGDAFAVMKDIKVYGGNATLEAPAEGTALLKLSSLSTNAIVDNVGSDLKLEGGYNQTANFDNTRLVGTGESNWFSAGITTNLPLNSKTKYTIEYEAKTLNTTNCYAGMGFSVKKGGDSHGVYAQGANYISAFGGHDAEQYYVEGSTKDTAIAVNSTWARFADPDGYTKFHVVIDGMKVTMYVGGVKQGTFDLERPVASVTTKPTAYHTSNLDLVYRVRTNDSKKTAGTEVADVKNISVYSGNLMNIESSTVTFKGLDDAVLGTPATYKIGDVVTVFPTIATASNKTVIWRDETTGAIVGAPYVVKGDVTLCAEEVADGTALIKLDNLNTDAVVSKDDKVFATQIAAQNAAKGEGDAILINQALAEHTWTNYGVFTNLPIGSTSKYTIEYKAKLPSEINDAYTAMCFAYTANNNAQGLYTYNHVVSSVRGYSTGYYTEAGGEGSVSFKNIWTAFEDADGYTTFHIEIDGYKATLFIGGRKAGTWSFDTPVNSNNAGGYSSYNLSLTFKQRAIFNEAEGAENIAANAEIANVKDIVVYTGNTMSGRKVTFYDLDGNIIEDASGSYDDKDVIDVFPTLTPKDPSNQIIWKVEHTNVMALAPYTVTGAVTFEAVEVSKTDVMFIGSQLSVEANENGTRDIRFVGGIYDLDGEKVGFEISTDSKGWDKNSDTVYKSILENVNGETNTITAEDKGVFYLFALVLKNVPTVEKDNTLITFTVKPYIQIGEDRIYGEPQTVSVKNGAFYNETTI